MFLKLHVVSYIRYFHVFFCVLEENADIFMTSSSKVIITQEQKERQWNFEYTQTFYCFLFTIEFSYLHNNHMTILRFDSILSAHFPTESTFSSSHFHLQPPDYHTLDYPDAQICNNPCTSTRP